VISVDINDPYLNSTTADLKIVSVQSLSYVYDVGGETCNYKGPGTWQCNTTWDGTGATSGNFTFNATSSDYADNSNTASSATWFVFDSVAPVFAGQSINDTNNYINSGTTLLLSVNITDDFLDSNSINITIINRTDESFTYDPADEACALVTSNLWSCNATWNGADASDYGNYTFRTEVSDFSQNKNTTIYPEWFVYDSATPAFSDWHKNISNNYFWASASFLLSLNITDPYLNTTKVNITIVNSTDLSLIYDPLDETCEQSNGKWSCSVIWSKESAVYSGNYTFNTTALDYADNYNVSTAPLWFLYDNIPPAFTGWYDNQSYFSEAGSVLMSTNISDDYLDTGTINITIVEAGTFTHVYDPTDEACTQLSASLWNCSAVWSGDQGTTGNYTFRTRIYDKARNANMEYSPTWFVYDIDAPVFSNMTSSMQYMNAFDNILLSTDIYDHFLNENTINIIIINVTDKTLVYDPSGESCYYMGANNWQCNVTWDGTGAIYNGNYTFNATIYDKSGNMNSSTSSAWFVYDDQSPVFVEWYDNQTYFNTSSNVIMRVNITDDNFDSQAANLTIVNTDDKSFVNDPTGESCTNIATDLWSCSAIWDGSGASSGNYTFNATVRDKAYNSDLSSSTTWFVYDEVAPDYVDWSDNQTYFSAGRVLLEVNISEDYLDSSSVNITIVSASTHELISDLADEQCSSIGASLWHCNATWDGSGATFANFTFNVSSHDMSYNYRLSASPTWFVYDTIAPVFKDWAINDTNSYINSSTSLKLTVNITDEFLNLSAVNITLVNTADFSLVFDPADESCTPSGSNTWACSATWDTSGAVSYDNYTFNATAYDKTSNKNSSASPTWFIYDDIAPVYIKWEDNQTYFNSAGTVSIIVNISDPYLNSSTTNLKIVSVQSLSHVYDVGDETCTYRGSDTWECNATWDGTGATSGNFTFNATSLDYADNSNTSTSNTWFVYDEIAPVFAGQSINDTNNYFNSSATLLLSVNITDDFLDPNSINITIINRTDESFIYDPADETCALVTSNQWSCNATWNGTDASDYGNYTFKTEISDFSLNRNTTIYPGWFAYDSTAPVFSDWHKNIPNNYFNSSASFLLSLDITDPYLNTTKVNITIVNSTDLSLVHNPSDESCALSDGKWLCSAVWSKESVVYNGNYTFNTTALDYADNYNISTAPLWFLYDNVPPALTGWYDDQSYFRQGQSVLMSTNISDDYIDTATINITVVEVGTFIYVYDPVDEACVQISASLWNCSATWDGTQGTTGNYTFMTSIYDKAVNTNTEYSPTWFIYDIDAPVFSNMTSNISYMKASDTVLLSADIYDHYLNESTINITIVNATDKTYISDPDTETCYDLGSNNWQCNVTWDGTDAVYNGNYIFNITGRDKSGNTEMSSSSAWFVYDDQSPVFTEWHDNQTYFNASGNVLVRVNITDPNFKPSATDLRIVSAENQSPVNDPAGESCVNIVADLWSCTAIWDGTGATSGNYTFNATVRDKAYNFNQSISDTWFVYDEIAPTFDGWSSNDTYLKEGDTLTVSVNITDDYLNTGQVNIIIINSLTLTFVNDPAGENCANIGGNKYKCSVEWDGTGANSGNYTFNVTARDHSGNTKTSTSTTGFVFDKISPTLSDWSTNKTYFNSNDVISLSVNVTDEYLNVTRINITIINSTTQDIIYDPTDETCYGPTGNTYRCEATWDGTNAVTSTAYRFNTSVYDMSDNRKANVSSISFIYDEVKPVFTELFANDTYLGGDNILLMTVNITDDYLNPASVDITIVNRTTLSLIYAPTDEACHNTGPGEWRCNATWDGSGTAGGNFTFNVTSSDYALNLNETTYAGWFELDQIAPEIMGWYSNDSYLNSSETVLLSVNISDNNLNEAGVNITVVSTSGHTLVFDPVDENCTETEQDRWICNATWDGTNAIPNANYTFNVTAHDLTGNHTDATSSTWLVYDNVKPVFYGWSSNDTFIKSGEQVLMTVNVTDNYLDQNRVDFIITDAGTHTPVYDLSGESCAENAPNIWYCKAAWDGNGATSGNYSFNATAYDKADNMNQSFSTTWFVYDEVKPVFSGWYANTTYFNSDATILMAVNVTDDYLNGATTNITIINTSDSSLIHDPTNEQCTNIESNIWLCNATWDGTNAVYNSNYTFNIDIQDYSGNSNQSEAPLWFLYDDIAPSLNTWYDNQTFFKQGEEVFMSVNIVEEYFNTSNIEFKIVNLPSLSLRANVYDESCYYLGSDVWHCNATWDGTNAQYGNYTFNVTAHDFAGNSRQSTSDTWFVFDRISPIFNNWYIDDTNNFFNSSITLRMFVNATDRYLNSSTFNTTILNVTDKLFVSDPTDEYCTQLTTSIWRCNATWDGTNAQSYGNYTYNVSSYDYSWNYNSTTSPIWFTYDDITPIFSGWTDNETYFKAQETVLVQVNITDNFLNLSRVDITIVDTMTSSFISDPEDEACTNTGPDKWTCNATWNGSGTSSGNFTFNTTAYDYADNYNLSISPTWFVYDEIKPIFESWSINDSNNYFNESVTILMTVNISDQFLDTSSINIAIVNSTSQTLIYNPTDESCTPIGSNRYKCTATWDGTSATENGNYSFSTTISDNSGNINTSTSPIWFLYDTIVPVFSEGIINQTYFNSAENVLFSINITEEYFNESKVNITVVNINSLAFVFDPTDESCTYKNNDIWECTATWNGANGVDNGNYTFNTTATDYADNSNHSASTKGVVYDITAPQFTGWTNNISYFKSGESVRLSVNITDPNLDETTINMTVVLSDVYTYVYDPADESCIYTGSDTWICNATWDGTLGFTGNFTFAAEITDKARNSNSSYSTSWSVYDIDAPDIENWTVNQSYFKENESVSITVDIIDDYLNTSTVNITVTNTTGKSFITDLKSESCAYVGSDRWRCSAVWNSTGAATYGNYSFNATAKDNSGNSHESASTEWLYYDNIKPVLSDGYTNTTYINSNSQIMLKVNITDNSLNTSKVNITIVQAEDHSFVYDTSDDYCKLLDITSHLYACNATWNGAGAATGNFTFNASATDKARNTKISSSPLWFVYDIDAPLFSEWYDNQTYFNESGTVLVSVNITDNYINESTIDIIIVDTTTKTMIHDPTDESCILVETNKWKCTATWTGTGAESGNYTFNTSIKDKSGNTNTSMSPTWFVFDKIAPIFIAWSTNHTNNYFSDSAILLLTANITDDYFDPNIINITIVNRTDNSFIYDPTGESYTPVTSTLWSCNAIWNSNQAIYNGNYTFNTTAQDYSININTSTSPIWLVYDNRSPAYSAWSINDSNGYINANTTISLSVNITEDYLNASTVNITIVSTSNYSYIYDTNDEHCALYTNGKWTCNAIWNTENAQSNTNYTFNITSYDYAGNKNTEASSTQIVYDNIIPTFSNWSTSDTNNYFNESINLTLKVNITDMFLNITRVNITIVNSTDSSFIYDIENETCVDMGSATWLCSATWNRTNAINSGNYTFNTSAYDYADNHIIQKAPLWFIYDKVPPTIFNLSTNDTDNVARNNITLNFTATAYDDILIRTVTLNSTNMTCGGCNQWYLESNASSLGCTSEGPCNLNAVATDEADNTNSTNYILIIDNTNPLIFNLKSNDPDDVIFDETLNLTFYVNTSDTISNVTVELKSLNGTNTTTMKEITPNYFSVEKTPEYFNCTVGWCHMIATATDQAGNQNSTSYGFIVDSESPVIMDTDLSRYSLEVNYEYLTITANVTDNAVVESVWANITYPNSTSLRHDILFISNSGTTQYNEDHKIGTWSGNYTPVAHGVHNVSIYAFDGNHTSEPFFAGQFFAIGHTSGTLTHTPKYIELANVTNDHNETFMLNMSLRNTGNGTMYDAEVSYIWPINGFYITSIENKTCGNISTSTYCNKSVNITITDEALTICHALGSFSKWYNADKNLASASDATEVCIIPNKTTLMLYDTPREANQTYGEARNISFYVWAYGNNKISNITFNASEGNLSTDWLTFVPSFIGEMPAQQKQKVNLSIFIPTNESYGFYTANITANATESICSPEEDCWDSFTLNVTYYGFSGANITKPGDSQYNRTDIINITCRVFDINNTNETTKGIGNYTDYLWDTYQDNSTTLLYTNRTNHEGYIHYSWNTSQTKEGIHNIKCNITDNKSIYYLAEESYSESVITLNLSGYLVISLQNQTEYTIFKNETFNTSWPSNTTFTVYAANKLGNNATNSTIQIYYNTTNSTITLLNTCYTNSTGQCNITWDPAITLKPDNYTITINATNEYNEHSNTIISWVTVRGLSEPVWISPKEYALLNKTTLVSCKIKESNTNQAIDKYPTSFYISDPLLKIQLDRMESITGWSTNNGPLEISDIYKEGNKSLLWTTNITGTSNYLNKDLSSIDLTSYDIVALWVFANSSNTGSMTYINITDTDGNSTIKHHNLTHNLWNVIRTPLDSSINSSKISRIGFYLNNTDYTASTNQTFYLDDLKAIQIKMINPKSLGHDQSNATGITKTNWTPNTTGEFLLMCNITNNKTLYYNASTQEAYELIEVLNSSGLSHGNFSGGSKNETEQGDYKYDLNVTTFIVTPRRLSDIVATNNTGIIGDIKITSNITGTLTLDLNMYGNASNYLNTTDENRNTITSIQLQPYASKNITITYLTDTTEGFFFSNLSITSQSTYDIINVSIFLETRQMAIDIISPNSTSPLYNIEENSIIPILANATYNHTTQAQNISFKAKIHNMPCKNITTHYNNISKLWELNCTAPKIDTNPINNSLTLYSTNDVDTVTDTEDNTIIYNNTLGPLFTKVNTTSCELHGNITITIDTLDYSSTDSVWITVININENTTYANTTLNLTNGTSINGTWTATIPNITTEGDYDIIIYANDTDNLNSSTNSWFDVYPKTNISGNISSDFNLTFCLYRPDTSQSKRLISFRILQTDYFKEIRKRLYDISTKVETTATFIDYTTKQTHTLLFKNVNITTNLTNPIIFNHVNILNITKPSKADKTVTVLAGLSINTTKNFTYTGNLIIGLNYSGTPGILDRPINTKNLHIYRCDNFNSSNCTTWSDIELTDLNQSNTSTIAYITTDHTSTYILTEENDIHEEEKTEEQTATESSSSIAPLTLNNTSKTNKTQNLTKDQTDTENVTHPFSATTNLIDIFMLENTSKEYYLILKNNVERNINIDLELKGELSAFTNLEKTHTVLESGKTEKITIYVKIPPNTTTGEYFGNIIATGENHTENISTKLTVTVIKAQYIDLKAVILTKHLQPIDTLKAEITLSDLRFNQDIPINMSYYLRHTTTDKIISESVEPIILRSFKEYTIEMPVNITSNETGDYYLLVVAYLDDSIISATDIFEIRAPFWNKERIKASGILLGLILISALLYHAHKWYMKKKLEKLRYLMPDYKKLPKKTDKSFWLGKIAETDIKAWYNPNDLTTHALTAGATGTGKSVSASIFVEEALKKGIPTIVFDPTVQWTGFVRPCKDKNLLDKYPEFKIKKEETKSFRGLIFEVEDPNVKIEFKKYMNPGEITVFTLNKLKPGEYDKAVENIVNTIFHEKWEESPDLKLLIVFDEVHRLLEKYGGKGGYLALEKACREFRKWGIGLIMCSQVSADFKEAVQGNILTEIQLNTKSMEDIKKIEQKYGKEYARRISREAIGVGMIQNPKYNDGKPWFIQFRPTLHSPHKILEEELEQYRKFAKTLEEIESKIETLKKTKDTFDIELELKLAKNKLKEGRFKMAEIYINSLKENLKRM